MEYIHFEPGWPEFTWDSGAVEAPLAALRHKQGRYLGGMEALGLGLKSEARLEVLMSDVVKSWAIEGEKLNPDEVSSSMARRLGLDTGGLPPASREVDGVVEMMLDATQQYSTPLTKERLFGWHCALFPTGFSGLLRISAGSWRAGPMQVVSGSIGHERLHFEAPEACRVTREMDAFLAWFESKSNWDPTIRAAIAHLWFLTIHPFDDGNGRLARVICDMALARADQTSARYYSLSAQLESERKQYYLELESAQRGGMDVTGWILWFLGCLDRAMVSGSESLASVLAKAKTWKRIQAHSINERQRTVLTRFLGDFSGFLTTSKYAKLAKCSHDSALRDIHELLSWGILAKNKGGGRSTSYRAADVD